MSSSRAFQIGGLALAGIGGYYLYNAGGDPKLAEKKAEADAAKLNNKVQSGLGGSGKEAKKETEAAANDIGKRAEDLTRDARNKAEHLTQDARKSVDDAAKKTEKSLNNAVDKFDKEVTEGASKAKSGISGWFGGK